MDSVTLRQTNFKLGDYQNPYSTTSLEQSKALLAQGSQPAQLDEEVKNDLRRSHFVLGNNQPVFKTISQEEFYDKSKYNNPGNVDFKNVERRLRATNYVLGNDKPDYVSETAAQYVSPPLDSNTYGPKKTISTAQLQQSHYVFGNSKDPWITTQQASFVPKTMDTKRYTKNLTKTNFILGDDAPTLTSVNQDTFVKLPYSVSNINKELAADLRKHHFNLGNENYPDQLMTVNHQDFTDPHLDNQAKDLKGLDPKFLRASHWNLGDDSKESPNEHYATTYGLAMSPKQREQNKPVPNSTFKTSFSITGNGPTCYDTESRSNFVPMMNKIDPKDIKLMQGVVKDIKSSHFNLGEMKNDFSTTSGNAYKFDPDSAKAAKGMLEQNLLNDLRATHYKLGYQQFEGTTTHQSSYVPLNIDFKATKDPNLQKSHFGMNCSDKAIQDGKTIYQTDYIKKPLPKEEDYCY